MPRRPILIPALAALTAVTAALAPLAGCAGSGLGFAGASGSGQVRSEAAGARLDLRLPERAAVVHDRNTADVYLTDLSPATLERLARGAPGPEVSGTLVHVHIFLNPKPGRTPIEDTAASATARIVILSRGQIGVYDAAGFLMPGDSLENNAAAGTLRNAATRISRATPGFQDLFGAARTELSFSARADQEAADRIGAAVRALALAADPAD